MMAGNSSGRGAGGQLAAAGAEGGSEASDQLSSVPRFEQKLFFHMLSAANEPASVLRRRPGLEPREVGASESRSQQLRRRKKGGGGDEM
jgi:hypothetical protein